MQRILNFVGILIALQLTACSNPGDESSDKSVFRYNESKGITSLDPAFARNQTIIWPVNQLFNGLVQLDDSLRVKPCIAKSWIISHGGTVYTFFLRDDVRFHTTPFIDPKNSVVSASDFVYSFERIIDPDIASPGSWIFDYLDELTINVKRVTDLLKICKEKLHKTETEVTKILDED